MSSQWVEFMHINFPYHPPSGSIISQLRPLDRLKDIICRSVWQSKLNWNVTCMCFLWLYNTYYGSTYSLTNLMYKPQWLVKHLYLVWSYSMHTIWQITMRYGAGLVPLWEAEGALVSGSAVWPHSLADHYLGGMLKHPTGPECMRAQCMCTGVHGRWWEGPSRTGCATLLPALSKAPLDYLSQWLINPTSCE